MGFEFYWVIVFVCFVVVVLLQIGVNFMNDYSDGVWGMDVYCVGLVWFIVFG